MSSGSEDYPYGEDDSDVDRDFNPNELSAQLSGSSSENSDVIELNLEKSRGEPFYKHLIGTARGICKKGKIIYDINPVEISTDHRNINPEKIKNVDELLTGHFGSTWKKEAENLRLQYYRDENRGNEEVDAQEEP
ncbi:unnamed protein product [Psylliodes chrysocephalus]|uniref:Uncharacterized protein n=1 Tax=Psylliodes chrysocephalus TaxID=3402493 RepID=A0A9P0CN27_9CUCU|nr:unnamed protein product [Psylliodes chrysocephala]